ncbi:MAG: hypothetical protein B7Y41_07510 [Hydrogenophilales bacterium 28-61-23]|nr:MAG: hypothetical protein B7Y41_07510 [Hydrogenophilales bacterium 28-61-23]
MNSTLLKGLRWAAIAIGVIGYSVLAHYSSATSAATTFPSLGVAVSLAPSLAILLMLAWRSPRRLLMSLACAGIGVLLWMFWGALERNFNWVYFLQHAGTNVMLAAVFGVTLSADKQPLCTRFAEAVHGAVAPDVARYTRHVTLAWTLFFLAVSLTSTLLFLFAPIEVWSIFANFLSFPLILLMFVAEYLVRLRMLPNMEKHSIKDSMLAYWKTPVAPRAHSAASPDSR